MEKQSPRFLVIGQARDNLTDLKALLVEAFPGCETNHALDEQAGLELARDWQADVILLDLLKLTQAACEMCAAFKADPQLADLPLLVVTADSGDKWNRRKMAAAGLEAVLARPVDRIELALHLGRLVELGKRKRLDRKERERLNALENKHKTMLDDLPGFVCEYLPDATLTYVNQAYADFFGAARGDVIGRSFLDLIPANERAAAKDSIVCLRPEHPFSTSREKLDVQGKRFWIEWRNRGIFNEEGRLIQAYSIGLDITARKEAEEKLVFLSYHDYLTGLYNRRYFEAEMNRLNRAVYLPLTIVMADVNGLKMVNDSFGHLKGDRLLKHVADLLQEEFSADAAVARIGGDEFAVVLANTDGKTAEERIARVRREAKAWGERSLLHSVSFGFSTRTSMDQDIHEVFCHAEDLMYQHKIYESASLRNKLVDVVMNSLFEKSPREMTHSRRVGQLAAAIASAMGFSEDRVEEIRIAGLIHDIGKMGVQEKILNKPGRLTPQEWAEIKKHPEAGYRILSASQEFKAVAASVRAHHERWDGSGYPKGLRGIRIPMEARIISVADAYDAMTAKRLYRDSVSPEAAAAEIQAQAGSQFDPRVAEAFLSIHMAGLEEDDIKDWPEGVFSV